uniref:Uncharacterized protein n=1 Tax=Panagrolaimus sp. ES5 TaxID=591445 RepID=A0AC34G0I1_9BILA
MGPCGQFHLELLNAIDDAARRLLHDEHYDLRIDKNNLEEGQIEPPEISNLQLIDGPVDQISGRAHIFIKRATLKLLTSKRKNDRFIVNNYEALLTNINANIDLRIATIAGHTHLIICFAEAPTSEIMLYDIEEGRVTGPEAVEIHDIICKAIGASIVNFKLESLISNDKNYNSPSSSDVNDIVKSDLSGGSDEILFEIYNPCASGGGSTSTDNTFLGLAIVGINELIKTNNPTQYLKLQGRPYHNDNVNGTLLVEFTFSYDPNVSLIGTHTNQTRLINRDGDQLSETIKHSVRPLGESLGSLKNGTHLEAIPTKTTTVTVKGVQRTEDGPHASLYDSFMNYDPHDSNEPERRQPSEEHSQSTIINRQTSVRTNHSQQQFQQLQQQLHQQQHQQPGTPLTKDPPLNTPDSKAQTFTYDHNELPPYMNRPLANSRSGSEKRKRERSFFGDLKDRLNKKRRSYGRSKSADPATSQNLIETESYPSSRDQSQGPYSGKEYDDHARYAGDDSKCTLVLELQRSGET